MDVGGPVGGLGGTFGPVGQGGESAIGIRWWARWGLEAGLVWFAGAHGVGHFVVDLEDRVPRSVTAVLFFVSPLHDRKRLHDIFDRVDW